MWDGSGGRWSGGTGEIGPDGVDFGSEKGNEVIALFLCNVCVCGSLWFEKLIYGGK